MVSDDICLVEVDSNGISQVIPVAPAVKLWASALQQLGVSSTNLPRVHSQDDKYRLIVPKASRRLPLTHLLFLEWCEDGNREIRFTPLNNVQSVIKLMELTHQEYLVKAGERQKDNFERCGKIMTTARTAMFRRPKNFELVGETMDALERYLSSAKTIALSE